MKKGVLVISPELLLEKLGIEDVTIEATRLNHFSTGNVEILLNSGKFPEYAEGAIPIAFTLEEFKQRYVTED